MNTTSKQNIHTLLASAPSNTNSLPGYLRIILICVVSLCLYSCGIPLDEKPREINKENLPAVLFLESTTTVEAP